MVNSSKKKEPGKTRVGEPPDRGGTQEPAAPELHDPGADGTSGAPRFPIVGIGASAGGIEALEKLFAAMPADTGMAFVVVVHLSPDQPSTLPHLLDARTPLAVEPAADRARVQPNHVYVIPPAARLVIDHGVLRVQTVSGDRRSRMPIDDFLLSLARDQQECAIGVILSGSGADGTLGFRGIREHGGVTLAQSPESAAHDSMPRSAIAAGLVDFVLPVEEIPARLVQYLRAMGEMLARKEQGRLDDDVLEHLPRIVAAIRRKTGHDFGEYRKKTVVRRIHRRMQVLRIDEAEEYLERLRDDPSEAESLFKDMLIGVTHFFRDPEAFEALERTVIPAIVEGKGADDEVRIWIPACATGEEAYSIAILLREEMDRRGGRVPVRIFAGDIDDDGLESARQGVYPLSITKDVSPGRLERFFIKRNDTCQVIKDVREMCIFSTHSLLKNPPFSRIDLICCRNFLIYLEPELQARVIPLFHYALRPGGYLFLGSSESLGAHADLFLATDAKHRIFQRRDSVLPPRVVLPLGDPRIRFAPPAASPRPQAGAEHQIGRSLERLLLARFAPAGILVNESGDILYISGRTGRFLEPAQGVPASNIFAMARRGLRLELRSALHRAIKARAEVVQHAVPVEADGGSAMVDIVVRPLDDGADNDPGGLYIVILDESRPHREGGTPEPEAEPTATRDDDRVLKQLESELRATKDHLQNTVEELEASNEELKSTNEELLSMNEELQSANEELQTSKEELQSLNEELQTVNAQLGAKVEELDTAYNDLHNLFQATQVAAIFVDLHLRINWFTPAATDVMRLIETDVGRPIGDIAPRFTDAEFLPGLRETLRTLVPITRNVQIADSDTTYAIKMAPYRTLDSQIDGVVVTFIDITAVRQSERARSLLASIVEWSGDAIISKDPGGTITSWNRGAEALFGYPAAEAVGRPITMIIPPDRAREESQILDMLARGDRITNFQTVRRRKDGSLVDASMTLSPIRDDSGRVIGASKVARDITDQKRAESELHAHRDKLDVLVRERTNELKEAAKRAQFAERMAALGTLSAGLGHDMGNLLMPIDAHLESIDHGSDGAEREDDIQAIRNCLQQLRHLVGGMRMLAIDPAQSETRASTSLRAWWDDIRPLLRNIAPRNVTVEGRFPDDLPPARIAGHQLSQAVFNLVQNAVDALRSRDRGAVTVWADRDQTGRRVRIGVTDDGPGMDSDVLHHCMEPFFSTKPRSISTGFGLALVQGVVRRAGGEVSVESEPGRGATFVLTLPVTERPADDRAPRPCAAVTIADARTRSYTTTLLASLGYEIHDGPCPETTLWIADGGEKADGRAPAFVDADGRRRIILIGNEPRADSDKTLWVKPIFSDIRSAINRVYSEGG